MNEEITIEKLIDLFRGIPKIAHTFLISSDLYEEVRERLPEAELRPLGWPKLKLVDAPYFPSKTFAEVFPDEMKFHVGERVITIPFRSSRARWQ